MRKAAASALHAMYMDTVCSCGLCVCVRMYVCVYVDIWFIYIYIYIRFSYEKSGSFCSACNVHGHGM